MLFGGIMDELRSLSRNQDAAPPSEEALALAEGESENSEAAAGVSAVEIADVPAEGADVTDSTEAGPSVDAAENAISDEGGPAESTGEGEGHDPSQPAAAESGLPPVDSDIFSSDNAIYELWLRWMRESGIRVPLSLDHNFGERENELSLAFHLDFNEKARFASVLNGHAAKMLTAVRPNKDNEVDPADAVPVVFIQANKLTAWLFVLPAMCGGGDVTAARIERAASEAGVRYGVDDALVEKVVAEKLYFHPLPLAIGLAPVPGIDGRVEELFPREKAPEFRMDEKGNIDFRTLNTMQQVLQGDHICNIILPIPGTDGMDVKGSVIKSPTPAAPQVPNGTNTGISEDGTVLFARMDGQLVYESGRFAVRPVLQISGNVDASVGNIDFRGDVFIGGDVTEDYEIRCTGSVTINGLVESARVIAGGEINVAKGVCGDGSTYIQSGKSVKCKFIENSTVHAETTVYADSIINSKVTSNNTISVMSGRGTIIGGELAAANLIEAKVIGTESNRSATLTLGILPNIMKERKELEDEELAIQNELSEIERSSNYVDMLGELNSELVDKQNKMRLRQKVLLLQQSKLAKKREALLAQEAQVDVKRSRVNAGTLYPMITLVFGRVQRTTNAVDKKCSAYYTSGEIIIGAG